MDTAREENAADLALTAFCWWRADLPHSVAETYWRDVHGIMFARAPGLWQYRQLRLAANRPDLWPADPRISFTAPRAAQPHGMPHGLFLSESDLTAFARHPLPARTIPQDTGNFIGRIGALLSPRRRGTTLVDRIGDPAAQGSPRVPAFVLCFVPAAPDAAAEAFHEYLVDRVAAPWSEHPGVLRLRVEPLPPYDRSVMRSPGVPHRWPAEDTYLGWIELAVRDENLLRSLLAGTAADGLARYVGAVHTYPIREIYTLVSQGRPTDVGLRGYPAVQAITAAGATAQRDQATLELLFGEETVRGLDRPGR
ncbi:ethyl tert-butyl ether degradation protein EthD [Streptomonospora alba]|uniref:ethyl tert-butyl ether degradation protein EthD n=1 Tax=Streptomonospora alba TaxID=183763 RepID=UPI001930EE8B|nr:ethyl tert-butyl ether degradation protein EthD [Streptomonospora alba]